MKYFLEFSYNGLQYHGWQKQPNAITVQEVLENALQLLIKEPVEIVGAGRTDTSVHARVMFAHFSTVKNIDKTLLINKLNAFLPKDIAIKNIYNVKPDAHARFDALYRTYEYWIIQEKNPFLVHQAYYVKPKLHIENMNLAAQKLLEFEDFKCFSKSNTDVKTYFCKVSHAEFAVQNNLLVFTITADRFLRNMVRAIVGTMLEVGKGKITIENIKEIIKSKNRNNAGASVPGYALYLTHVEYPKDIFINNNE